jgi:hypothetical protein
MSRTGRVRPTLPLAMAQPTSGDRVWLSWRGWDGRGRGRTDVGQEAVMNWRQMREDMWQSMTDPWDRCDLGWSKLKKFQCTIYIIRKIVLSEIVFETRIWNFSMAFLAKWKQTRLAEPIARITQSRSFQGRLPSHRRSFHWLNSKQLLFSEILDTISHVPWRGLAREGVNPRICQYKFSPACGLINDVSVLSSVAGILP